MCRKWTFGLMLATLIYIGNIQIVFGGISGKDIKAVCDFGKNQNLDKNSRDLWYLSCLNYIQGTVTGWQAGMIMATGDTRADEKIGGICIPDQSTAGDWTKIVTNWMENNQDQLHKSATLAVILAMKRAYPCTTR